MIVSCARCGLALDVADSRPGDEVRCRCTAVVVVPHEPRSAGGVRCPGCGATATRGATACAYCNATLATMLCARCLSRNFLGSHHCSQCGDTLPLQAEVPGTTELACPGCSTLMVRRQSGGFGVECCPACGGVFMEHDTQDRLLASRPRTTGAQGAVGRAPTRVSGVRVGDAIVYRKCPRCSDLMNRRTFARGSGIIIDVCATHGTYFDNGELRQVLAFVETGGLEEAKRKEIDQLRYEAQRARSEHTGASLAGYDVDRHQWGGGGILELAAAVARSLLD